MRLILNDPNSKQALARKLMEVAVVRLRRRLGYGGIDGAAGPW